MEEKMAAKLPVLLIALLISYWNIYFAAASSHENALNVPQLLLPYVAKGSEPTTFVLKALKGCFKW